MSNVLSFDAICHFYRKVFSERRVCRQEMLIYKEKPLKEKKNPNPTLDKNRRSISENSDSMCKWNFTRTNRLQ